MVEALLTVCFKFVEGDFLQRAGFASRKAMKTAMYERAKVSKTLYMRSHLTDLAVSLWSRSRNRHTHIDSISNIDGILVY